MDASLPERLAAIAVWDAARGLAREAATQRHVRLYRRIEHQIDDALSAPNTTAEILLRLVPRRRGKSLVGMLLAYPGADPVRADKFLLRALEWDDD